MGEQDSTTDARRKKASKKTRKYLNTQTYQNQRLGCPTTEILLEHYPKMWQLRKNCSLGKVEKVL